MHAECSIGLHAKRDCLVTACDMMVYEDVFLALTLSSKVHDELPVGLHAKHERFVKASDTIRQNSSRLASVDPNHSVAASDEDLYIVSACLVTCLLHSMIVHRGTFGHRGWGGQVQCLLQDLVFAREEVSFCCKERGLAGMKRLPTVRVSCVCVLEYVCMCLLSSSSFAM